MKLKPHEPNASYFVDPDGSVHGLPAGLVTADAALADTPFVAQIGTPSSLTAEAAASFPSWADPRALLGAHVVVAPDGGGGGGGSRRLALVIGYGGERHALSDPEAAGADGGDRPWGTYRKYDATARAAARRGAGPRPDRRPPSTSRPTCRRPRAPADGGIGGNGLGYGFDRGTIHGIPDEQQARSPGWQLSRDGAARARCTDRGGARRRGGGSARGG